MILLQMIMNYAGVSISHGYYARISYVHPCRQKLPGLFKASVSHESLIICSEALIELIFTFALGTLLSALRADESASIAHPLVFAAVSRWLSVLCCVGVEAMEFCLLHARLFTFGRWAMETRNNDTVIVQ